MTKSIARTGRRRRTISRRDRMMYGAILLGVLAGVLAWLLWPKIKRKIWGSQLWIKDDEVVIRRPLPPQG